MLPLFHIKSLVNGNRLCCTPFSHKCGYIGDREHYKAVMDRTIDLSIDLKVDYVEIRDATECNGFCSTNSFSDYCINLSSDPADVWKNTSRNVKRGVEKSHHYDVSVTKSKSFEDMTRYYDMNCLTKRKIGVPCHPWKFLHNFLKYLNAYTTIYLANYKGEAISGIITTSYKNTISSVYSADNLKHIKLYPNSATNWKIIEDGCKDGFKYYDLGRASYANAGLIEFKKRLGGTESKLYYGYFPEKKDLLVNNRNSLKYTLGTQMFRNMPLPAYKLASNVVFSQFG